MENTYILGKVLHSLIHLIAAGFFVAAFREMILKETDWSRRHAEERGVYGLNLTFLLVGSVALGIEPFVSEFVSRFLVFGERWLNLFVLVNTIVMLTVGFFITNSSNKSPGSNSGIVRAVGFLMLIEMMLLLCFWPAHYFFREMKSLVIEEAEDDVVYMAASQAEKAGIFSGMLKSTAMQAAAMLPGNLKECLVENRECPKGELISVYSPLMRAVPIIRAVALVGSDRSLVECTGSAMGVGHPDETTHLEHIDLSGEPAISTLFLDESLDKKPMVWVASPVEGGWLALKISPEDYYSTSASVTAEFENGEAYVVDRYGTVITPLLFREDAMGRVRADWTLPNNCLMTLHKEQDGRDGLITRGVNYQGQGVVGSYVRAGEYCVVAEVVEESLTKKLWDVFMKMMALVSIGAIFLLAVFSGTFNVIIDYLERKKH